MDLVVGEPYAGYHELQYEGGVTVLFGSLDEGDTEIGSSVAGEVWGLVEGWKVRCVETPCGLGTSMSSTKVRERGVLCQTGVVVGAPYAGVGGYQRGAALALDSEMEAGGVYTVPGDLSWLPGSEGTQVKVPISIFCQDYERSASSLKFFHAEDSLLSGVGLIGSPTARACAKQVDEVEEG